jgi:hypothetical protein
VSVFDVNDEVVRNQSGQDSQTDGAPASAGLAAQLATGRAALHEAQQQPAARRGLPRRTVRIRAPRSDRGSGPAATTPTAPPEEPSVAARIASHLPAGTAPPGAALCPPDTAVTGQVDPVQPVFDSALIAGDVAKEEHPGSQTPSAASDDVVELFAGLVEWARAAEQDAASARAQLEDLTTAITELSAVPAPTSTEHDTAEPGAGTGRRTRPTVTVLAGVAAVVALALSVWVVTTHQSDPAAPTSSSTTGPPPTRMATTAPSPTATVPAEPAGESGTEEQTASDQQAEHDQAAAEAAAAAERAAQDQQGQNDQPRADAGTGTTGQGAQQSAQQDAPVEPTRASHQQTVTCTTTATVTFTAAGGGQVDLTAGDQSATGAGGAVLSVSAGPGPISASATGDGTVAITYVWAAPGGTCS